MEATARSCCSTSTPTPASSFCCAICARSRKIDLAQANARSAEIEAKRCLPDDIAQAIIDSGVLRLWIAKAYGGYQASISALLDATETLAYYDGSTGWMAMVTGTASFSTRASARLSRST